jgi:peptide deformylase
VILKVSRLGHPVLRRPTEPVSPEELATPAFQRFLDDMADTMREYDGVGLAANQVHVGKLAAVIESEAHPKYPDEPPVPLTFLVNPVIVERSPETVDGWEGCLSVPDLRGKVPRSRWVRVRALDRRGKALELRAEGLFARIIQHECDHLAGGVYLDRMPDLKTLSFTLEQARFGGAG